MTNPPLPDDELASALVDGLGDDQERARLASDPALAARVEQLRAVRQAVATSTAGAPPSAEARERAIAAALAAAAEPAHELPPSSRAAPVELDARRNRRKAWLPAAAAAAVVAVLGLGAFAALRDRGADGDSQVTAAAEPPATTLAGAGDLQRESTFDAAGTTPAAGGATTTATARSGQDSSGAGPADARPPPRRLPSAARRHRPPRPTACPTSARSTRPTPCAPRSPRSPRSPTEPAPRPRPARPTRRAGWWPRLTWLGQPALVVVVDGPPSRGASW